MALPMAIVFLFGFGGVTRAIDGWLLPMFHPACGGIDGGRRSSHPPDGDITGRRRRGAAIPE